MIHPHTELRWIDEEMGSGVFATRPIPRGTITWVRDALDQVIASARVLQLGPSYREILERYCYLTGTGDWILCWDLARYINHSCEATCLGAGYDFEIAVRDIAAGEELTDDYGSLNLTRPFACRCRSVGCRGNVLPEDFERLGPVWDATIERAFPLIGTVPQPLWSFVAEGERAEVEAVLAGRAAMRSGMAHFCPDHARLEEPEGSLPWSPGLRA